MKRKLAALVAAVGVLAAGAFYAMPSQAATSQLSTMQSCLPDGSVRVDFSWRGNDPSARQQWLDLSLFDNGWEWGTFLGAGPMPGSQTSLRWDGLISGTTHFVRVNQQLANGAWDPSATYYFKTAACTPAPKPPVEGRTRVPAPIDDIKVMPLLDGAYSLVIKAGLPSGCAQKDGFDVSRSGNNVTVKVWNTMPSDNPPCTLIYGMYDVVVPLGVLNAGQQYQFFVNDKMITYTP
ncbi:MAG: hypothetical protein AB7P33_08520 [Dehalococcoidia bacterium]